MSREVGQFKDFDLLRLVRRKVRIVVDDAVLVFLEQGLDPPDLVVDLDGTVFLGLDLDPFVGGVGQRETLTVGTDYSGDLLGRNGRFALGVDILERRRTREGPVGFGHDERLPVLAHDDLVELFLAVGAEITQIVLLVIGQQIPLLVLGHVFTSSKKSL